MSLTPRLDLRGGEDCWRDDPRSLPASDPSPARTEVAIVGAGVTGAILADRLASNGRRVVILDRRTPATGSTGASTALGLWAADAPLVEHIAHYGLAGSRARWRAVYSAVQTLDRRARALGLSGWGGRPDLYLAGDRLDVDGLHREGEARRAAGLPSTVLTGPDVHARFGVRAAAALLSGGAYSADPVMLTRSLLDAARRSGAALMFPTEVTALEEHGRGVTLRLHDGGVLEADQVILATGYEVGPALPRGFRLESSFAAASAPGQAAAWKGEAMVWEASDPYLYLRTTPDGRIVVGGEDEAFADPARRDALIAQKAARLADALSHRLEAPRIAIDCAWAATFGASQDGLPGIGRRSGCKRTFVAHSFGGNGIAFAVLAADLLPALMAGTPAPVAAFFRPDRFE